VRCSATLGNLFLTSSMYTIASLTNAWSGFRVSGLGFRVRRFEVRGSDLGSRVPGFALNRFDATQTTPLHMPTLKLRGPCLPLSPSPPLPLSPSLSPGLSVYTCAPQAGPSSTRECTCHRFQSCEGFSSPNPLKGFGVRFKGFGFKVRV
jgi:hypothetical protein